MNEQQELIKRVNEFILEKCAPVALSYHSSGVIAFPKKGNYSEDSAFTEADLKIQMLLREFLGSVRPEYGFIGEEKEEVVEKGKGRASKEENGESLIHRNTPNTKYWVVDPIDGTRAFKNGGAEWGISVGLIEEKEEGLLVSSLGSVYFPCEDALYYSDGTASFEVRDTFRKSPVMRQMSSSDVNLEKIIKGRKLVMGRQIKNNLRTKLKKFSPGSYVAQIMGVARGDYLAAYTEANLWDMAACHAIAKPLGVGVYDAVTGKRVDNFRKGDFQSEKTKRWKLKKPHIVCYEEAKKFVLERVRVKMAQGQ